ncbi:ethanolamine permease [Klebsiella pneumoniae]|uniref:Ethanolamine permease n=1 Tax=Klebsiella pneumoniae TaxID=573 RepID=A0A378FMC6_KLEPN|nr:ethanolamine permease [Klebsiella pneumoniae]
MTEHTTTLKRTLGSFRLWGIAVGLVISGEYFGWSYGWSQAGTMGFMVVALAVAAMYCAFIFSFTELTTAIPHAGGPFAYAYRAFGPTGGFIAGFATLIEFVFARRPSPWPSGPTSTCSFRRWIRNGSPAAPT